MSFQNVPSEVLEQIFHLLPERTTLECILVCKAWHTAAARVYYSNIRLSRKGVTKLIKSLVRKQQQQPNRRFWIKTIHFKNDIQELVKLPQIHFEKLLTQLVNVKIIDLTAFGHTAVPYLRTIYKQTVVCLKGVQEIKVDKLSYDDYDLHFAACYWLRETITHLNIYYDRVGASFCGEKDGTYVDHLGKFKSLTHLSIQNTYVKGDSYLKVYAVLDACPTLVDLKLHTDDSLAMIGEGPEEYNTMSRSLRSKILETTEKKVLNTNLKNLDLQVRDFDEAEMKYIIMHTPQLDNFKMRITNDNFYNWLSKGESTIYQLARHLSPVKNLDISIDSLRQESTRWPQLFSTKEKSTKNLVRQWDFVDAVMGTRKLHFHVTFTISGHQLYDIFKVKVVNDKKMLLQHSLKPEYIENILLPFIASYRILDKQGPYIIDSLEIGDSVARTVESCPNIFRYALEYCPRLKLLLINRSELCYRLEAIPYPYNIEFDKVIIKNKESENYITDNMKDIQDRLNHVLLKGAILTPELMRELCTRLPHIKVLKLIECTIPKDFNESITLNLKGIHHLHYLELDIMHLVTQPFGFIFIIFEMPNNITMCYYKSLKNQPEQFTPTTVKFMETHQAYTSYAKAAFITIQCEKVDRVAINSSARIFVGKTILKPGVDPIPLLPVVQQ